MEYNEFAKMWTRLQEESEFLDKLFELGVEYPAWTFDYACDYICEIFPNVDRNLVSYMMFESAFGKVDWGTPLSNAITGEGLDISNPADAYHILTGEVEVR